MRKKLMHFLFFCGTLTLFNACSNDELDLKTQDNSIKESKDIEVVDINDYLTEQTRMLKSISNEEISQKALKFKDEGVFERTKAKLENMSEEERSQWFETLDGFNSLQAIFDKAMEDVEFVDETEESYMNFKAKYDKYLYFPMYEDDYGVYIPMINQETASVTNPDGLIIVGNEVRSLKDIVSYSDLQQSGQAYYDVIEESSEQTRMLKSWNISGTNDSKHIGKEASSGWHRQNKRKLKLNFGRRSNRKNINPLPPSYPGDLPKPGGQFAMNLHLEVSFRKKTWIGWVNYSSITDTQMTIKYSGRIKTASLHKNNYSSHDWFDSEKLPWGTVGVQNQRPVFQTPQIEANFVTNFRGFKNTFRWTCILPTTYFTEK